MLPDTLAAALGRAAAALGGADQISLHRAGREVSESIAAQLACDVYAVILYGSRLRAVATAASDWDVLAVTGDTRATGVFGESAGVDLDIHALERRKLSGVDLEGLQYLLPAAVLFDTDHIAADLLAALERRAAEPPPRMPRSELARAACWVRRTSHRIRRELDAAPAIASFRLAWLETDLYDYYFRLRGVRRPPIYGALEYIRRDDPACGQLIDRLAATIEPRERLACLEAIAARALAGAVSSDDPR